jgi:hypothetical protein
MKLQHLAYLLLLLIPFNVLAGKKTKLIEGSLEELKGVKKMNLQLVYEGMTVGKKNIPDEEYVNERKEEMNKKEAGKGSTWALGWKNDRSRRFEPGFKNGFNKIEDGLKVGKFPDQKYTLIFKSTNLEPGYNVGVSRDNASLSGEGWIVETANPDHIICKISIANAPGAMGGFDFDNGLRIEAAYSVAGNMLSKFLKKTIKS